MRRIGRIIGSAALMFAIAGCGSGSGGTCGRVEPCGGDVVGSWTISDGCINPVLGMQIAVDEGFTALCPTSTLTNMTSDASGGFSFNADLTYSSSITATIGFNWNVQTSCLGGMTCAEFNAAIQAAQQQNPDPGIQSITCAGSGTCVCRFIGTPQSENETGTYTTSGTAITTTASDGTVETGDYCIQDNTFHVVTVDRTMNTGPMGQATILSDITATRGR